MLVRPLVLDFFLGFGMVALGLVPGPLTGLRDALQKLHDIRDITDLYRLGSSTPSAKAKNDGQRLPGQLWLAAMGATVMGLSTLGFLWQ